MRETKIFIKVATKEEEPVISAMYYSNYESNIEDYAKIFAWQIVEFCKGGFNFDEIDQFDNLTLYEDFTVERAYEAVAKFTAREYSAGRREFGNCTAFEVDITVD